MIKFKSKPTFTSFITIINYATLPSFTFHGSEEQTQQYIPASNLKQLSRLHNLSISSKSSQPDSSPKKVGMRGEGGLVIQFLVFQNNSNFIRKYKHLYQTRLNYIK